MTRIRFVRSDPRFTKRSDGLYTLKGSPDLMFSGDTQLIGRLSVAPGACGYINQCVLRDVHIENPVLVHLYNSTLHDVTICSRAEVSRSMLLDASFTGPVFICQSLVIRPRSIGHDAVTITSSVLGSYAAVFEVSKAAVRNDVVQPFMTIPTERRNYWRLRQLSFKYFAVGCQEHSITNWLKTRYSPVPWGLHTTPEYRKKITAALRLMAYLGENVFADVPRETVETDVILLVEHFRDWTMGKTTKNHDLVKRYVRLCGIPYVE